MTALPGWLTGVEVEEARVPASLDGATSAGVLWQAARGRFLLDVPDVARYLVVEGRHVGIDAAPTADPADVTRFLRLTPLAALLFQRGVLALHAAAAVPPEGVAPGGAVLITGESATGKSTLLAALLRRGWLMLADDLAVVDAGDDGVPMVWPTFPEVRLWPDARKHLGMEHVCGPLAAGPAPLCAVVGLTLHNGEAVEHSELRGKDRFQGLCNQAYNVLIAKELFDRGQYLRQVACAARATPFLRLRRPRGRWCADELADRVSGVA